MLDSKRWKGDELGAVHNGGRLDDISTTRALAIPAAIAVATIALAAAISLHSGVSGWWAFPAYLGAWAATTFLLMLVWLFIQVAKLLPSRADSPLRIVSYRVPERVGIALLPALIFPLFLGGYTWAKCSIPFAAGYGWERTWANVDRRIFGTDAWRWSHQLVPDAMAPAWSFYYAVIWGFVLVFSGALIGTFATRRLTTTYFTALMLSWLIGGIVLAYSISAAGPVFAHLVDPDLGSRFLPLKTELARILGDNDLVLKSQRYLEAGTTMKIAVKGGGVSAMPSMHMATCTLLLLAAWRTPWIWLAVPFWLLTFFGSLYLGYHYAVDAPVAATVAVLCWFAARKLYVGHSATLGSSIIVAA